METMKSNYNITAIDQLSQMDFLSYIGAPHLFLLEE